MYSLDKMLVEPASLSFKGTRQGCLLSGQLYNINIQPVTLSIYDYIGCFHYTEFKNHFQVLMKLISQFFANHIQDIIVL